jgi:hypothetical protein
VAGYGGPEGYSSSVEYLTLDTSSTCASPVPDFPTGTDLLSTVRLSNSTIVSCGGRTSSGRTSSCYTWTPGDQTWTTAPSLPASINSGDMVTTEEKIIFIGGRTEDGFADEIYDIDTGLTRSWDEVATLTTGRLGHCSVAHEENVVITGGYDGAATLSSVEIYKLGDSSTTTLSSLNDARSYHGCTLFTTKNGDLQLIVTGGSGGASGGVGLKSVEISTKTGSGWSSFVKTNDALPGTRSKHTTTQVGHLLYTVAGAVEGASSTDTSILVSDDGTNWNTSSTTLTLGRQYHTAVATTDLC